MQDIIIKDGSLILSDSIINNGSIHISGGKIVHIGDERDSYFNKYKSGIAAKTSSILKGNVQVFNAKGLYVCPALVELHIHGCGGYDLEGLSSGLPEKPAINKIASFLSRRGVGYFLPTIVFNRSVLSSLVLQIKNYEPLDRLPGIYMEGPFISREKRGGIHNENIEPANPGLFREIYELSEGYLKIMTMAPEIKGADIILNNLLKNSIIPAFGHSNAQYSDVVKLLKTFNSSLYRNLDITHLYNGMSGVSHKTPGLAHWALLTDSIFTELNCDGTHVHPAALELTFRLRPYKNIVLISDATPAAGLAPGNDSVTMRGKRLIVEKSGVFEKESGVLVGSRLLVNDSIYKVNKEYGIPLWEVINMASANPLRLLGINNSGLLKEGMQADISVFDKKFKKCYLQLFHGEIMHSL